MRAWLVIAVFTDGDWRRTRVEIPCPVAVNSFYVGREVRLYVEP